MNPKFDKLNLTVPADSMNLNFDKFGEFKDSNGHVSYRYEQTTPFNLRINWSKNSTKAYVEFSAKILMDNYPELINKDNIEKCFQYVQSINIAQIDFEKILDETEVNRCDVTCDLPSEVSITDLYRNLSFNNVKNYSISQCSRNRFSITNTCVTERKHERLIIYDKDIEFNSHNNVAFRPAIQNLVYQQNYFKKNSLRFELNLKSKDRIRKYFNLNDNEPIFLKHLLNSKSDPIFQFLSNACRRPEDGIPDMCNIENPRDIQKLLFMAYFGFDLREIDNYHRRFYGGKTSFKHKLEPYNKIYDKIKNQIDDPITRTEIEVLRKNIHSIFNDLMSKLYGAGEPVNLIDVYETSKGKPNKLSTFEV